HTALSIIALDPGKAPWLTISLVQHGSLAIELVQVHDPLLETSMRGTLEQMPVEARLVAPLPPLAKLAAHEEEFFARLGIHITQQESEVSELLPIVPGHFAEQRPLAIDDLIMRQGQDEIFVEGVEETKRQRIMVELTMDGIVVHIVQHIVHPAHIPF